MKRIIFSVLKIGFVNFFLIRIIKLFSPLINDRILTRVPVVGYVKVKLPNDENIYLKTDGSDSIASKLYWKGLQGYECGTLDVFLYFLEKSAVVLDIGANTGIFALLAGKMKPSSTTYAFEPVAQIFSHLKNNVACNNLNNIHPIHGAVTDFTGKISIHVPVTTTIPTSASTLKGFRENTVETSVTAFTLDNFIEKETVTTVDLIKIDTEATEHKVLIGAKNILRQYKPTIICEVLKGRTEKFLNQILSNTKYKYFLITNDGLIEQETIKGDPSYTNMNYLFIEESKITDSFSKMILKLT